MKLIHEYFEEQAKENPSNIAIVHKKKQLTYYELNKFSNQLARHIRSQYSKFFGRELTPDTIISLLFERGIDMIIAILAILKAGAAYAPIDTNYPISRIKYILKNTNSCILLTNSFSTMKYIDNEINSLQKLKIIAVEEGKYKTNNITNLRKISSPQNLAYVIHTSGTTGNPKGVMIEHQSFVSFIKNFQKTIFSLTSLKYYHMLSMSNYVFDIFGLEYALPLMSGDKIILTQIDEVLQDEIIQSTIIQQTPSLFKQLIKLFPNILHNKVCLVGGEPLSNELGEALVNLFDKVLNVYGPTETTIWSTCYLLEKGKPIYIGYPLIGEKTYVLNENMELIEKDQKGELYISGVGIARGYLNQIDLTKQKFVLNPFADKNDKENKFNKLYKTGDLVRYTDDGNIEYIGRTDFQVKIRGHRIELAEIEFALNSLEQIQQACVICLSNEDGERIVAYYTAEKVICEKDIISGILLKLPDYMVPAEFIFIENFPLTNNGKIDRKKLSKFNEKRASTKKRLLPRSEVEKLVFNEFKSLFKIKQLSVDDDFFKLGGDSLTSIFLVATLRNAGFECNVEFLRKNRTIEKIAENITRSKLGVSSIATSNSTVFLKPNEKQTKKIKEIAKQHFITVEKICPANFMQRNFILQFLKNPEASYYHVQVQFDYQSEIDLNTYEEAWRVVLRKHPSLRIFFSVDRDFFQVIYSEENFNVHFHDVSHLDLDEHKEQFVKKMQIKDRERKFDLERPGLLRVSLIKKKTRLYKVIFSYHHSILDGMSERLLLDNLHQYYNAIRGKEKIDLSIENSFLETQDYYQIFFPETNKFWEEELKKFSKNNEFPEHIYIKKADGKSTVKKSFLFVESEDYNRITKLATDLGITKNVLIQFAWHKLIQSYTGDNQTIVGTVVFGRDIPIENISQSIGLYTNTLPLIINWVTDKKIIDILFEIHKKISELNTNSYVDLLKFKENSKLFSNILVFNSFSFLKSQTNCDKMPQCYNMKTFEEIPFDLGISVSDEINQFAIKLSYLSDKVTTKNANRYLSQFKTILLQLPEKISFPWHTVTLLTKKETETIVYHWNQTREYSYEDQLIHKLIEKKALENPDRIALVFKDKKLTYYQLNKLSDQLAIHIIKIYNSITGKEIVQDTLIALCLKRCPELVIAMLAILKAGAAYVPIDPGYPKDRVRYILEDTKVKLILTETKQKKQFNFLQHCLEIDKSDYFKETTYTLPEFSNPNRLAYVIYTSGTTGKPKGVMIEHGAVPNFIFAYIKDNRLNSFSRVACFLSIAFDAIGSEIYTALFSGSTIFMADDKTAKNVTALLSFFQVNRIDIAAIPAAIFNTLRIAKYPKKLVVMGDTSSETQMKEWYNVGHQIMNGYGPTEVTIGCTGKIYDGDNNKNIGRPMNNKACYILDKYMQVVPPGIVGELYVGGVGLARGYLNQDDLTKEKFIPNPFSLNGNTQTQGNKLYKTGDLAKWLEDGNIEFIGRSDSQVKVSGFRVELNEIETNLLLFPGIKECIVTLNQEANNANEKFLMAYYTSKSKISDEKLRKFLLKKLPNYMLPKFLVPLTVLPLNQNGKVDKSKLPKIDIEHQNIESVEENNSKVESVLKEIWYETLGVPVIQIKSTSNFFNLGGNSLLAVELKNRINDKFLMDLTIADLFAHPKFSDLSDHLKAISNCNHDEAKQVGVHEDIAIIGLSGMFSGCKNIDEFWKILKSGQESISVSTKKVKSEPGKIYVNAKTPDIDKFDPDFWNIAFRDAKFVDPQIRKFLESCWEVLERSGYIKKRKKINVGVFAGCGSMEYLHENILKSFHREELSPWEIRTKNGKDFLSTYISYLLGLTGPSLNINTACSTALVAIVEACEKLASKKCDVALAGAVSFLPTNTDGYVYTEGLIFSKNGHCCVFDNKATGTTIGSGCGVVLLKTLSRAKEDNDVILGVISGYATNNDGAHKASYTAPSEKGQIDCILKAQAMANVQPHEISYIECHGTGTKIGDAIEVQSLAKIFKGSRSLKKGACFLGSVKANIGHADSASGIAGLIKVIKMLEEDLIIKQINFKQVNKEFSIEKSPFLINTENRRWKDFVKNKFRIAGISSFGIGGSNAHIIIKEYIEKKDNLDALHFYRNEDFIIPLSAKSYNSLIAYKRKLSEYVQSRPKCDLYALSLTLQNNRESYNYRTYIACKGRDSFFESLENSPIREAKFESRPNQKFIFMFPGQGTQFPDMGLNLYKSDPDYRRLIDEGIEIINKEITFDFKEILYPSLCAHREKRSLKVDLNDTCWAQPALFLTCYATARFVENLNIKPTAYIGHSIGEYVSAALSGAIEFQECLKLVLLRGQLMQSAPKGSMLAIYAKHEQVLKLLSKNSLELAVINSPEMCVIAGADTEIKKINKSLQKLNIQSKILNTSHAFHSSMMNPIKNTFLKGLRSFKFNSPNLPVASNLTGDFFNSKNRLSAEYFSQHMVKPVQFFRGIQTIEEKFPEAIFIEIGPGYSLSSFTLQLKKLSKKVVETLGTIGNKTENFSKNEIMKNLWLFGLTLDFGKNNLDKTDFNLYDLPTYQFLEKEIWISPQISAVMSPDVFLDQKSNNVSQANTFMPEESDIVKILLENNRTQFERKIAKIFSDILGCEKLSVYDSFYQLGGTSLSAVRLVSALRGINIDIALSDLVNINSIEKIAKHFSLPSSTSEANRIIIPLEVNNQNARENIFFIHAVGGSIFPYLNFVNRLPKTKNYYGIQNININGKQLMQVESLEQLAIKYVDKILELKPKNKIILMGSSMGGTLAYEMAYQLLKSNIHIDRVFMFDAWAEFPDSFKNKKDFYDVMSQQDRNLKAKLHDIEERQLESLQEARWQLMNLLLNYKVKKSNINIELFKAKVLDSYHEKNGKVNDNFWGKFTSGNINIYPINGDHESIHEEPGLTQIIKHLKQLLVEKREEVT